MGVPFSGRVSPPDGEDVAVTRTYSEPDQKAPHPTGRFYSFNRERKKGARADGTCQRGSGAHHGGHQLGSRDRAVSYPD